MNRVPAEDKRLENIARYFDDKIQTFGPNPQGVDWKDERGQILRFNSFETLFRRSQGEFSVIDFGCGYGALVDWLDDRGFKYSYLGLDISADMVASAKSRLGDKEKVDFRVFSGERGACQLCLRRILLWPLEPSTSSLMLTQKFGRTMSIRPLRLFLGPRGKVSPLIFYLTSLKILKEILNCTTRKVRICAGEERNR